MYKDTYLSHHGVKGQKWGLRRFQNEDGTLTSEGRQRYDVGESIAPKKQPVNSYAKVDGFIKGKPPKGAKVEKEPRTRWGRGKKIQDEMYKIQLKKEENLRSKSKEFQKNKDTLERLEKRYGLNKYTEDDSQNPKRHEFSKDEMKAAKEKYWQKIVDQTTLDSSFEEKAARHAERVIEKKYGKVGMSDVKHYNNVNTAVMLSALGGLALAIAYSNKKGK